MFYTCTAQAGVPTISKQKAHEPAAQPRFPSISAAACSPAHPSSLSMQAAAILRERRELAAARAAAQAAAAQMVVAEAERRKRFERPSHRSTAWESKVAVRAEKEAAFLEGSSTGHDENAQVGW